MSVLKQGNKGRENNLKEGGGGYKGMGNQARPDLHGFVSQSYGAKASGKMGRTWRL
ncbi:hypothetical protein C1H46_041547 [Malus baccata]|uniref:Uncharacterized protein n=1 Tax=Malus baccata TaxID=106549 RepID=A0A540KFA5_MALBA|nr:hypothetical protein C1H46_041547 [Malus baccata]